MRAYKYLSLLAAQLILMIVSPLFQNTVAAKLIFSLAVTVVFVAAIYSISHERRKVTIGLVLMLPAFITLWLGQLAGGSVPASFGLISATLFFSYTAALILMDVLRSREVTMDIIAGGISVYLLIGNIWGFIFALIGYYDPQAFFFATVLEQGTNQPLISVSSTIYYSFVTLTTLGYGDILPVSAFARTFSYLEAVIGQIYLVVLIARLVGLHLSKS